jgi:hypothetical protein
VLPTAFAIILSAYLPLSVRGTGRTPSQTKPLGGIEWSQEKPAKSSVNAAALGSLYSEMAQEPHHDLKGIVIVRRLDIESEFPLLNAERDIGVDLCKMPR